MNKIIIDKIENIIKLSNHFDSFCGKFSDVNNLNEEDISNHIYNMTNLYMALRSEHGSIIMLLFNLKNEINDKKISNNYQELYDLSVLSSIVENITSLISNTDYQYKRISLMFPNLIRKSPPILLLFTNNDKTKDKYTTFFEQIKKKHNEYMFKVVHCNEINTRINCGKILNKNLSIKILELPTMYLISNDKILQIPLKNLDTIEKFEKFLE